MNHMRFGQTIFNALDQVDNTFTDKIRGTTYDCFHNDSMSLVVLAMWSEYLRGAYLPAATASDIWEGMEQGTPGITDTLKAKAIPFIPTKTVENIPEGVLVSLNGGPETPINTFGDPNIPTKSLAHEEAIKNLKVKVHAYRGMLIIETVDPDNDNYPGWTPCGGTRIGCVLANTRTALGISHEAMEFLKKVPRSRDDIGDVDWWKCNDGTYAFAWLGGQFSLKSPDSTGSRTYEVAPEHCVPIPNNPPLEAMDAVDRILSEKSGG